LVITYLNFAQNNGGTKGYVDHVPVAKVREYKRAFLNFMRTMHPEVGANIAARKLITPETEEALKTALEEFNRQ